MLNVKWMGFRRQVDGTSTWEVTRSLFCFTDTTLIDRPIDSVASIRLFVYLSRSLYSVRLSFFVLYKLKSGVPLQGCRPIVTYDYSVRTNHVVPCIPRVFVAIALCPRRNFLNTCPLNGSFPSILQIYYNNNVTRTKYNAETTYAVLTNLVYFFFTYSSYYSNWKNNKRNNK